MRYRGHWEGGVIKWREPATWVPAMTKWLRPHLRPAAIRALQRNERNIEYEDDYEWLDALDDILAVEREELCWDLWRDLTESYIHTYHGCRTKDVESYVSKGVLVNNPDNLESYLRKLIAEESGFERFRRSGFIEGRLAELEKRGGRFRDRDTGKLYLCLDDRSMLNGAAGHYLLYGSEWIVCIFDQHERGPLRSIGLPTFIEVKLPLEEISEWEKGELMQYMLMEWARFVAVRDRNTRIIDCSFTLKNNVPPEYITGHYHPSKVRCPFDRVVYKSPSTVCPSCS